MQYRLLFENSPIPMWVVDSETQRYLAVNDAAVEHYGYSREEFLAMDLWQIRPAEDSAAVRSIMPKKNAGIENKGIWRHLKKDGSLIKVEIVTHTMEFGGRSAWLVAAFNVTDRLDAEQSLRKLQLAVEHAENVIFMTDPGGTITFVNPAFEKIYGYSKEEVLGKTPRILKSGQQDRAYYERFWQRLLAGESVRGEFVNRTREGQRVSMEAFVNPVLDAKGRLTGFIAVQHDVSERTRFGGGAPKVGGEVFARFSRDPDSDVHQRDPDRSHPRRQRAVLVDLRLFDGGGDRKDLVRAWNLGGRR